MSKNKNNKSVNSIKFMNYRIPFGVVSIILMIASILILSFKGLNYGVDFQGGTLIQLQYEKKVDIQKVRDILHNDEKFESPNVSKFGSDQEITIKTQISSSSLKDNLNKYIKEVLKETGEFEIRRIDMVGPKVGNELREKGLLAIVLALIGILIYVSIRYEYKFALSSIIPLFHDVLITLGIISILEVEVNLDVLAAVLTIIGYSLNDTIIIFDRIRENIVKRKEQLLEIIDISITKTLSRTLITSLTTLFVVLTLYFYGGEIINPFSITLLIGIIIGTYSSIYIASSFLVYLNFSVKDYKIKISDKEKRSKERELMRTEFENGVL